MTAIISLKVGAPGDLRGEEGAERLSRDLATVIGLDADKMGAHISEGFSCYFIVQ